MVNIRAMMPTALSKVFLNGLAVLFLFNVRLDAVANEPAVDMLSMFAKEIKTFFSARDKYIKYGLTCCLSYKP